jgi:hypothetical protein
MLTFQRVASALQKPNLLKYNSDMSDWAEELKREREYESDETLGLLVSLRKIDDHVQDDLYSHDTINSPFTDTRVAVTVRFYESMLTEWRGKSQAVGSPRCKFVLWYLSLRS